MKQKTTRTEKILAVLLLIAAVWLLVIGFRYDALVGEYNNLQEEKQEILEYGCSPQSPPMNYTIIGEVSLPWPNVKR